MTRVYEYVGAAEIGAQANAPIERLAPTSPEDIRRWSLARLAPLLHCTYVVDTSGQLVLSDRHSEHVACARGGPVLGAGEVVLRIEPSRVVVQEITNQSTGFCPEPECWAAVRQALERAGLRPPNAFTHAFEFRRCESCSAINVLKPEMPECPQCGTELPDKWNFTERD